MNDVKCVKCGKTESEHKRYAGGLPPGFDACPICNENGQLINWHPTNRFTPAESPASQIQLERQTMGQLSARIAELERERDEARQRLWQRNDELDALMVNEAECGEISCDECDERVAMLRQKLAAVERDHTERQCPKCRTERNRIPGTDEFFACRVCTRDEIITLLDAMIDEPRSCTVTDMRTFIDGIKHDRDRLRAENERLRKVLEWIASKSQCESYSVPGMGSGLPHVWRGCAPHNSDDPEEWCLCCAARAALEGKGGVA